MKTEERLKMEVTQDRRDNVMVLAIKGRLDSGTSADFEAQLLGLVRSGENRLILDLRELDYISSSGLRVLLKAAKELKQTKGRISLCRAKDYVREVFEMSGFISFLPIFGTVDEGLKNT
jgi:anti-sigma B factor antagonist